MHRFEQRDARGTVTEVSVIDDATLMADPDALVRAWSAEKTKPGTAPEGYDHIGSVEGDPDALRTEGMTHYYAKKGSYQKEKPSKLSGLRAGASDAEKVGEAKQ